MVPPKNDRLGLGDRFWSKASRRSGSGCWVWTGGTSKGYGLFWQDGRTVTAHVIAFRALVGEIPEGRELDHVCRRRACVNPAHLEPVLHRENVLRGEGITAKQARKTHCPKGHSLVNVGEQRRCSVCRLIAGRSRTQGRQGDGRKCGCGCNRRLPRWSTKRYLPRHAQAPSLAPENRANP